MNTGAESGKSGKRARGGDAVIPTFALERAQELLFYLKRGVEQSRLPPDLQFFVDSPMAISATEIAGRHPEFLRPEIAAMIESDNDPFAPPRLRFTKLSRDSMAINDIMCGAVILAGSGMCNGGRVRHHLKHNLWRERCSVVFVGYAAQGTLARRIVDGADSVKIFNQDIPVRAQVWTINGFSAHAGQPDLLDWLGEAPRRKVFLVHGEYDRGMHALQEALEARGVACQLPGMCESIKID